MSEDRPTPLRPDSSEARSARPGEPDDSAAALDRLLPPPAFPPGGRKGPPRRHLYRSTLMADLGIPEEAVISPDAPFRPRGEPALPFEFEVEDETSDEEEIEITGIGEAGSPYYDRGRTSFRGHLNVEEVAAVLEETARILREEGPVVLLRTEGGSRFDSTLRGFVAGYLIRENE